jgi:hypothetical protein
MIVIFISFLLTLGLFIPVQVGADIPSWEDASTGLPTDGTYFGVEFADINNDGNIDIVGASDGQGLRVFLGDGAGSWTDVAPPPASSGGYGDVALGDYDADDNLDIFVGSPGNSDSSPTGLHVFKGDGAGGFTEVDPAVTTLPTEGKWRGVDTGDVNNDGHLDLAATAGYHTTEGIHVYLGDGTGTFTDSSSGLPINEDRGSGVTLADFNDDGILDVAAGGTPGVSVYLGNIAMTGDMAWVESSSGLPSQRFTGVCSADVTGDDLPDLLLASYDAGSGVGLRVFKNNNDAASWTSISTNLPESGDYLDVSAGDFDLDGDMDLVSGGVYGTKGIRLYYGDGSGTWTEGAGSLPQTGERVGCDVGDFDSDGDSDLLFGRYNRDGLEVFRNTPASVGPPQILSTSPTNDAQNVPLNTEITITFNVMMDTTATEGAISMVPAISWSTTWSGSDSVLTLSPSQNLDESTQYTISISTDAESANDVNLASSYEFTFTTGSSIDTSPPIILSTTPSDNSKDVNLQATISITFSEPMDSSVADSAISISPSVTVTYSWDPTGEVLTLSFNKLPETTYTVTISSSARDLAGNQMGSQYSFSFTTESQESESEYDTSTLVLLLLPIFIVVFILIILLMRKRQQA